MTALTDERPYVLARFMETYAKQYAAGAFAMPTGKDIAARPDLIREWTGDEGRTVAHVVRLSRDSVRRDFTGRRYVLPRGSIVATHLARTPDAPLPNLDSIDYLFTYTEDHDLTRMLHGAGRIVVAERVSAASELVRCWGRPGADRLTYQPYDLATVTRMPATVHPSQRAAILRDLAAVDGWDDDFPYYSDGSWSAVSLRGFYPEDPRKGVKPREMPRTWRDANADDLDRPCEWTTLADRCPSIKAWVESISWWGGLERVRLLRMAGRAGAGGQLRRHTDITDRAAGLADGQIARFHLPLVTDPRIELHAWTLDGKHTYNHLAEWTLTYLDARKPHAVTNPTGVDRIHLVADVVADVGLRARIAGACEAAAL